MLVPSDRCEILRIGVDDRSTFGLIGQEVVNLLGRAVVGDDVEALVVHVQNQVLALRTIAMCKPDQRDSDEQSAYHDGQPDESNISTVDKISRGMGNDSQVRT